MARWEAHRFAPFAFGAAAVAAFTGMDTIIKLLLLDHHVLMVSFTRYALACLFALAIWRTSRPRVRLTKAVWRNHALRGVMMTVAGVSFHASLGLLPLVEAITLGFVAPLLVPPAAQLLSREPMRAINLLAGAIGFAGVLIASHAPPSGMSQATHLLGVAAVMVSCVSYAAGVALARRQAVHDGAPMVQLMSGLIPALILFLPAMTVATPPRLGETPLFVLLGLTGAAGAYFWARAYALAEAQTLAPIEFTAIIWAPIFSYAFFHQAPRFEVLLAAPLIFGACALSMRSQSALAGGPKAPNAAP